MEKASSGISLKLLPRIQGLKNTKPMAAETLPRDHSQCCEDDYVTLKEKITTAVKEENFESIQSSVQQWQTDLDSAPDYLFIELILINPLAMAVRENCHSVVEYLMEECDMRLEIFHKSGCTCRLCLLLFDDTHFMGLYADLIIMSLTAPIYIYYSHSDSIIPHCLSLMKKIESRKHFLSADILNKIKANLETAMISALDAASNTEEVRYLMRNEANITENERLLGNVMDFASEKFKQALAHPASQSILLDEWYGKDRFTIFHLRRVETSSITFILHSLFCYIFVVPLTIILPFKRLKRLIDTPSVKFQTEFASFWVFLIVAVIVASRSQMNILMICKGRKLSPRMMEVTIYQVVFACLLITKLIRLVTLMIFAGTRSVVGGYDRLQFFSVLCYCAACCLTLISLFIVPYNESILKYCQRILKVPNIEYVGQNCSTRQSVYSTYTYLPTWTAGLMQPYLIGSVLFSIGHVTYFVSAGQLLYMIKPMSIFTIAVQKMVIDCFKWGIFFLLFLLGWAVATITLYSGHRCETSYFADIYPASKQYFWAMFAMSETSIYKLTGASMLLWSNSLVQYLGLVFYAGFLMVGTLILVNLLIALMTVTYQSIHDSSAVEVNYWQSKVNIKFILWRSSLPLPLNVLYPIYLLNCLIWKTIRRRQTVYTMRQKQKVKKELSDLEVRFLHYKQKAIFKSLNTEVQ